MHLTMDEKRDLLERLRELVLNDVIQKEDRDDIFRCAWRYVTGRR